MQNCYCSGPVPPNAATGNPRVPLHQPQLHSGLAGLLAQALTAKAAKRSSQSTEEMLLARQTMTAEEFVLLRLSRNGPSTPLALSRVSETSRSGIARLLRRLLIEGKVVATGTTRNRRYSLPRRLNKEGL